MISVDHAMQAHDVQSRMRRFREAIRRGTGGLSDPNPKSVVLQQSRHRSSFVTDLISTAGYGRSDGTT